MSAKNARSGSEKRQRQDVIKVRVSPQEKARVMELVARTGHDAPALARNALFGTPLPRKRRPRFDGLAVSALMTQLAAHQAELGKIGSNLNQIAFHYNAGRISDITPGALEAALQDHDGAIHTLLELRAACLKALGFEDHDIEL
jgi:hypothetical protein